MSLSKSNTIVHGSFGMGKTTAAVIKFMNAVKIDHKYLQCLFICINYESAYQAYSLGQKISNGSMNLQLVKRDDANYPIGAQVIFGSAHDIVAKFESWSTDVSSIDLICFDDAERTMALEKTTNCILNKLKKTAKVVLITSRTINDPKVKLLGEKLSKIREDTIQHCSVENEYHNLSKEISHYAVEISSHLPRIKVITDICDLVVNNSKCKLILFCQNKNKAQDLNNELVRKYDSKVILYCGKENYEARAAFVDQMSQDNCPIIVATEQLGNGIDVPKTAICIINFVKVLFPDKTPDKSFYSSIASRAGRFGRKSIVISLLSQYEMDEFKKAFPICTVSALKFFLLKFMKNNLFICFFFCLFL